MKLEKASTLSVLKGSLAEVHFMLYKQVVYY